MASAEGSCRLVDVKPFPFDQAEHFLITAFERLEHGSQAQPVHDRPSVIGMVVGR